MPVVVLRVVPRSRQCSSTVWRFRSYSSSSRSSHSRRGAEAFPMAQTVQQTIENSTVAVSTSLLCRIGKFLGCRRGEDSRVPHCSRSRVQTWRTRLRSHSCSSSTLVYVQDWQVPQVQSWKRQLNFHSFGLLVLGLGVQASRFPQVQSARRQSSIPLLLLHAGFAVH